MLHCKLGLVFVPDVVFGTGGGGCGGHAHVPVVLSEEHRLLCVLAKLQQQTIHHRTRAIIKNTVCATK
jgi:hypothetical protein